MQNLIPFKRAKVVDNKRLSNSFVWALITHEKKKSSREPALSDWHTSPARANLNDFLKGLEHGSEAAFRRESTCGRRCTYAKKVH